ncbi:MAG: hypothetical protein J6J97_05115 [Akkermansia sp.]|nr:hypothetical protein [Akkermansia sp.]
MKKSLITMMVAALASTAFAGTATTDSYQVSQQPDFKRLSGAVHVGAGTAYTLHGYVPTRAAVQGEGVGMGAVQLAYDFGKEGFWSYTGAISYKAPFSGHTLYGNPTMSRDQFGAVMPKGAFAQIASAEKKIPAIITSAWANGQLSANYAQYGAALDAAYDEAYENNKKMGAKNIENEFILRNGLKYTRDLWNVSFGHDFIHGGIAGVVAKHFDGESQSRMQQFWTNMEITPVAWFSADMNIARTFDTIDGWWFEWHARFKAPIVGSPEDIKVAGILEFGLSATSQFYTPSHNACDNGLQAYWVKLSTPWFVNDDKTFILTPSVSFNWLGRGGRQANKQSHAKAFGSQYVPFRDFTVIGDLTATYRF